MKNEMLKTLLERVPSLNVCEKEIERAYQVLIGSFEAGGKLLLCGNGGSAADCDHIAGELMKGFLKKRPLDDALKEKLGDPDMASRLQRGLTVMNLCAPSALLSAISNDIGADIIYAQQVIASGRKEDVLIGISTSGNSENVLKAVKAAKALGMKTIGLTGLTGGALLEHCDVTIRVPESETYKIQELHLSVYHALCAMVEEYFF